MYLKIWHSLNCLKIVFALNLSVGFYWLHYSFFNFMNRFKVRTDSKWKDSSTKSILFLHLNKVIKLLLLFRFQNYHARSALRVLLFWSLKLKEPHYSITSSSLFPKRQEQKLPKLVKNTEIKLWNTELICVFGPIFR